MTPVEVVEASLAILEAAEKIYEFVERARAAGTLSDAQSKRVEDIMAKRSESGALLDALGGK